MKGNGPLILNIHGLLLDHFCMHNLVEKCDVNHFKRLYIDLPGMGKTTNYDDIISADDILESLINFINKNFSNEKIIIVGESYGGYLARGLMSQLKDQVIGAFFICPVIIPNKNLRTIPYPDTESKITSHNSEPNYDNEIKNKTDKTKKQYSEEILRPFKIANKKHVNKLEQNYSFKKYKIDNQVFLGPVYFLMGLLDNVTGYEDAFKLKNLYPNCEYHVINSAGHYIQIDKQEYSVKLLNSWLENFV
ncbi:alpha/beta fold hydrolase [Staphylococcus saprophyticus]|uniref:alpha/beta fold hydrolase n=2 Tax=Bacteria TaxID=2 RepID=UPI0016435064